MGTLEVGRIFKFDKQEYKYVGTKKEEDGVLYKFLPLNSEAVEVSKELYKEKDIPFDGYIYMTLDTVFDTFFGNQKGDINW